MIFRRKFLHRLLGGALAVISAPAVLLAETQAQRRKRKTEDAVATPTPESTPAADQPPAKEKTARLRLWKTSDAPDQPIQLRFLLHDKPTSEALSPLKVETGSYQFTEYIDFPNGPIVAEIGVDNRPTVLRPWYLASDAQATLLVRLKGNVLSVEWIDDTTDPASNSCDFEIYNLLPASGEIQVDLGNVLTVHLASVQSSLRLTSVKKANYPVLINGTDGEGKNFRWTTEADLRHCRKATLLIYPDAYGRIRPRISTL